jgi:transposase-like protein
MSEASPVSDLIAVTDADDTDTQCRAYLEALRWPNGVTCPRCSGKTISCIKARKVFDCDRCRYQFSVTAGTLFHDSHLPLSKWFVAIFLVCESRQGMSANQLKRILKVSYKTSWYLCHRIRAAMTDNPVPLRRTVEADETYIGSPKHSSLPQRNRDRHTMILAAIERGGRVRMSKSAENTDFAPGYLGIEDASTRHERVNQALKEYARGDTHTNTVENVFSLFKRSIVGSFHQITAKHVDRYLDEFEFRFNNRKNPYLLRDTLLKLLDAKALPYDQLTAQKQDG